MVLSATGKKPMVAPYSGAMLAIVARSVTASDAVPSPKNSTNLPTTFALRSISVTEMLRKAKVVGKFVEFFGEGTASLAVTDRATIANMAPEYGATMGFFPVADKTIDYFR